jgi:hypothetical protein
MHTVARTKRTAPRERTATPAELAEDRRRCLAARASIRDLRADLKRTANSPAIPMAELVESRP